MKSSGMPTMGNDTPVETYSEYKEKMFTTAIAEAEERVVKIKHSSLKSEDKEALLLRLLRITSQ